MIDYYSPIWESGKVSLKDVASFSNELRACPSNLLGRMNTDYVRFEIPSFQRGITWTRSKRQEFLTSLWKGWPTGALVLTRTEQDDYGPSGASQITWQVLDGQQRLATFKNLLDDFWRAPWYSLSEQLDVDMQSLCDVLDVRGKDEIKSAIQLLTLGDEDHPFSTEDLSESSRFLSKLCLILGVAKPIENDLQYPVAEVACRRIRTSLLDQRRDLAEIPVAIITITPQAGLSIADSRAVSAGIFAALNSGIPLTKYELLAASWSGLLVPWSDFIRGRKDAPGRESTKPQQKELMEQMINDRIADSWRQHFEDIGEDVAIEEVSDDEISLYDFLYALSRSTKSVAVTGKEPAIRSSFPEGAAQDTMAFDVVALLFAGGLDFTAIEKLQELFPRQDSNFDIRMISDVYLQAAKDIDASISSFSLPSRRSAETVALGVVQSKMYLASYINIVWKLRPGAGDILTINVRAGADCLTTDGTQNLNQASRVKQFRQCLPAWWLLDILSDNFQGSDAYGNAKARVWHSFTLTERQGSRRVEHCVENDQMLYQPLCLDLLSYFVQLFIAESVVPQAPTNRRITQAARAVVTAAYKDVLGSIKPFELDHVVAFKARKQSTAKKLASPIPLNHPANWMPLSRDINKRRSNQHWSTFFTELSEAERRRVGDTLLIDPLTLDGTLLDDLNNFLEAILVRWVGIVDRALHNIGLKEYEDLNGSERISLLRDNLVAPIIGALPFRVDPNELMSRVPHLL